MKKNYYTLQVVTNLDLAGLLAAVPTKLEGGYIAIEKAEMRSPAKVVRGRPPGAGVNRHTMAAKEPVDRKAASLASAATMQERLGKSVDILVGILKEHQNLTMEQLCEAMTVSCATNRYNRPWTPKNLWPYYEKAYARLEGQIQLSYVAKPEGASTDELATS